MFGFCGPMGLGGWLLMAGFWVAVVVLVVWVTNRLFPAPRQRADAVELLAGRLAAGEIDAQAYRTAREELLGAQRR